MNDQSKSNESWADEIDEELELLRLEALKHINEQVDGDSSDDDAMVIDEEVHIQGEQTNSPLAAQHKVSAPPVQPLPIPATVEPVAPVIPVTQTVEPVAPVVSVPEPAMEVVVPAACSQDVEMVAPSEPPKSIPPAQSRSSHPNRGRGRGRFSHYRGRGRGSYNYMNNRFIQIPLIVPQVGMGQYGGQLPHRRPSKPLKKCSVCMRAGFADNLRHHKNDCLTRKMCYDPFNKKALCYACRGPHKAKDCPHKSNKDKDSAA